MKFVVISGVSRISFARILPKVSRKFIRITFRDTTRNGVGHFFLEIYQTFSGMFIKEDSRRISLNAINLLSISLSNPFNMHPYQWFENFSKDSSWDSFRNSLRNFSWHFFRNFSKKSSKDSSWNWSTCFFRNSSLGSLRDYMANFSSGVLPSIRSENPSGISSRITSVVLSAISVDILRRFHLNFRYRFYQEYL